MRELEEDGYIYCNTVKGMYRLTQSGKLDNEHLTSRLDKFGYKPFQYTPVPWHKKWRPIAFSIIVVNFGVKFEGIQHVQHLKEALGIYHELSKELFLRSESQMGLQG